MPSSKTEWFCDICKQGHKSEDEAIKCEQSHYKIGKIIGVYYKPGKRAPVSIQVEVDIGTGWPEKDIFYHVSGEGWGAK